MKTLILGRILPPMAALKLSTHRISLRVISIVSSEQNAALQTYLGPWKPTLHHVCPTSYRLYMDGENEGNAEDGTRERLSSDVLSGKRDPSSISKNLFRVTFSRNYERRASTKGELLSSLPSTVEKNIERITSRTPLCMLAVVRLSRASTEMKSFLHMVPHTLSSDPLSTEFRPA